MRTLPGDRAAGVRGEEAEGGVAGPPGLSGGRGRVLRKERATPNKLGRSGALFRLPRCSHPIKTQWFLCQLTENLYCLPTACQTARPCLGAQRSLTCPWDDPCTYDT